MTQRNLNDLKAERDRIDSQIREAEAENRERVVRMVLDLIEREGLTESDLYIALEMRRRERHSSV